MEMSALSKRREKLVKNIRTNEREIIKRELRAQLLSEEGMANSTSSLNPSNEISIHPMAQFEQEMLHFIACRFGIQTVENNIINSDLTLSVFCESISKINHPQGIIDFTECYKSAMSLVQKHFDLISNRKCQSDSEFGDYLEEVNRWSHVLNLVLLRIKLKSVTFPMEIFEIEELFSIWLDQALEGMMENYRTFQQLQNRYGETEFSEPIMKIKDISLTLKEIYSILEGQEDYNRKETIDLLERIFSNKMVSLLVACILNFHIDDSCRLTIAQILLQLTEKGSKIIYYRIIDSDYIDSIRLLLQFTEENLNKSNMPKRLDIEKEIVIKMCRFIASASLLHSSDLFWKKSVCSDLRFLGMMGPVLEQQCISTLFACIISIKNKQTLDSTEEDEVFDWALEVINSYISRNGSNPDSRKLIDKGENVIKFLLKLGECNGTKRQKIRLQQLQGESILSKCEKCRLMLRKQGFLTHLSP